MPHRLALGHESHTLRTALDGQSVYNDVEEGRRPGERSRFDDQRRSMRAYMDGYGPNRTR
ncbi:MAG: hypothetical protein ACPGQS_10450 [Bradymonadia bacterium]